MAKQDNLELQRNAFKASTSPSAMIAKMKKIPVKGSTLKPKTKVPTSNGLNQIGSNIPTSGGLNQIGASATSRATTQATPPSSVPTSGGLNQIGAEAPQDGSWIGDGRVSTTTPARVTPPPAPSTTPTPPTAAPATAPTPTGEATAPTSTPSAATATTGLPGTVPSGINEAEMLRLGVSQEQIDRAKQVYNPLLAAGEASIGRGEELYKKTTEQLTAEQQELEKFSQSIADRKTNLTNESIGLVEESAQLKKARAQEEYQANQFRNEQAKKEFELDQGRTERELELSNIENETRLRRAMGAQVGAAYGSQGLEMMGRLFLDANSTLADLRTKTSIGKAEFSFKAMDIESNYTNSVNQIINDSKAEKLALKANLDDDLDAIDSQILSSKEEKQAAAREALKEYYNKVDTIEMQNAELISTANKDLFTEKKELEQEKLEKETFDPSMSEELGFFANRYGQPIGVPEGSAPKPYAGGWDEALSQQFGHLVDSKGRPIIGTDGNKISYKDLSAVAYQNSLSAFASGDYNVGDLGNLNFSMGVNNVISSTLENGKVYSSPKYGKLQCGEYINDQFLASRQLGSDFANADALIKSHGGKPGNFKPQIGDVVFMNTGDPKIPHKAIIEGISEDGQLILTDANYTAPGQVRHGWKVPMDDKKLYGYARLPLKANVAAATPAMTETSGTDGGPAVFKLLDQQFGSIEEYEAMKGTEAGREMLRTMRTEFGAETVNAWVSSKSGGGETPSAADDITQQIGSLAEYKAMLGSAEGRATLQKLRTKYGASAIDSWVKEKEKTRELIPKGELKQNQWEAAGYGLRVQNSGSIITSQDSKLAQIDPYKFYAGKYSPTLFKSEEFQVLDQAMRDFVNATLRRESGAAIAKDEFINASKQYFPQPGDSAAVIENKRKNRLAKLAALRAESGDAWDYTSQEYNDALRIKPMTQEESIQSAIDTGKKYGGIVADFGKALYSNPKPATGGVDLSKYLN